MFKTTVNKSIYQKWAPLLYFVVGQAGWFACVLGAAHGWQWAGVALTLALVALHVLTSRRPIEELKLIACVVVIGGVWDSGMVFFGLLAYPGSSAILSLVPVWILALWALFAAQFNTTYQWLKTRLLAAAVLGAVAGPLSFRAGAALGAVRFVKPLPAAVTIAAGWACILPLIVLLSRRWDGVK